MLLGEKKNKIKKIVYSILLLFFVFSLWNVDEVRAQSTAITDAQRMIDTNTKAIDELLQIINTCFRDSDSKITNVKQEGCPEDVTYASYDEIATEIDKRNKIIEQNEQTIKNLDQNWATKKALDVVDAWKAGAKEGLDTVAEWKENIGPGAMLDSAQLKIVKFINDIIIRLTGIFLEISGRVLNATVDLTILGMDKFVSENAAIKISWTIIRDLINILFIFGLLYISILIIISKEGSSKIQKLLIGLLASAVLINFSYFFTAVLIDASNYLTTEIYQQLGNCVGDTKNIEGMDGSKGISNCFMDKLSYHTINDPTKVGYAQAFIRDADPESPGGIFLGALMGGVFVVILSWVFLALAIMLAIRFIMLVFLLITSPVLFLQWVLPNFKKISSDWFSALSNNLLFPPFAFLFLFITLQIADSIKVLAGTSPTGAIMGFILIIGFAVGSIIIAKRLGASGASFATKWSGAIVGGAAAGGAAYLGRNTIGRGAAAWADRMKGTGIGSRVARSQLKSIGNKTFDARGTKSFQGIASATGITAGKAGTKGFTQIRDQKKAAREAEYKEFGEQTTSEKQKIHNLTQEISTDYKEELDGRKKLTEKIDRERIDANDLRNQLGLLKEESQEYKDILAKAKEVAESIRKSKEDIQKIDTDIQNDSKSEKKDKDGKKINRVKLIEETREAGKERQGEYLKQLSGEWYKEGSSLNKVSKVITRPSSKQAAMNIKEQKIKAKDGGEGDLEKILKDRPKNSLKDETRPVVDIYSDREVTYEDNEVDYKDREIPSVGI